MRNLYSTIVMLGLSASAANAQYCSPSFPNGCFSWTNQSISIGTINWTNTDCLVSDFTTMSTTVNAGASVPMTVVNGNWTGCAVWVDLNNDQTFQDTENLYYSYVGGDPSYTYSFNITIPANTPTGSYRMRVIAPWGSDGFLDTNVNGYGPCGSYQYGNFDDFTLEVSGSNGFAEGNAMASGPWLASANPTNGRVALQADASAPLQRIIVRSLDGRTLVDDGSIAGTTKIEFDLGTAPDGVYLVECVSAAGTKTIRVSKH